LKEGVFELKCKRARKMLLDYVNGTLEQEDSYLIQEHTTGCDLCRRELDTLSKILKIADNAKVEYPPASVWENFLPDLHKRIEREAALIFSKQYKQRLYFLPGWAAFATVVILTIFTIVMPKYYPSAVPFRNQTAENTETVEPSSPPVVEESPEPVIVAGMISRMLISEAEAAELDKLRNFIQSEVLIPPHYGEDDIMINITEESRSAEEDDEGVIQFLLESEFAEYGDNPVIESDIAELGAM
jgi:hypothetical protein